VAITDSLASSAAWGSIFGIGDTTLGSICRPNFNPKYWISGQGALDIVSGKNAWAINPIMFQHFKP
jgi:hypothetical protein